MKRYLAFCGAEFYPEGGMHDFRGEFNTVKEAVAEIRTCINDSSSYDTWREKTKYAWYHIYDTEKQEIIFTSDESWDVFD